MIQGRTIEIFEVGGYNCDVIYDRFNELTGLNLEFDIDQSYGTDCYGVMKFSPTQYPTLEELEAKILKYKKENLLLEDGEQDEEENFSNDFTYGDCLYLSDIVDYLRRKGELPEANILFEVSY